MANSTIRDMLSHPEVKEIFENCDKQTLCDLLQNSNIEGLPKDGIDPHKLYRSILARTQQPKRVDKSGARKKSKRRQPKKLEEIK